MEFCTKNSDDGTLKHGGERSDYAPCHMRLNDANRKYIDDWLFLLAIVDSEVYNFSGCSKCGLTFREMHELILKDR